MLINEMQWFDSKVQKSIRLLSVHDSTKYKHSLNADLATSWACTVAVQQEQLLVYKCVVAVHSDPFCSFLISEII